MHKSLVLRGEKWLEQQNCKIVINDGMAAHTVNREKPDVIGWRNGKSILIECKASRADFLTDAKKKFRANPDLGMGDYRFYMCPPGIINIEDLPEGWGLLWVTEKTVQKIHNIPTAWTSRKKPPFNACKTSENQVLVSALRRLALRGYLPEIYDGPVDSDGNDKPKRKPRAKRVRRTTKAPRASGSRAPRFYSEAA